MALGLQETEAKQVRNFVEVRSERKDSSVFRSYTCQLDVQVGDVILTEQQAERLA